MAKVLEQRVITLETLQQENPQLHQALQATIGEVTRSLQIISSVQDIPSMLENVAVSLSGTNDIRVERDEFNAPIVYHKNTRISTAIAFSDLTNTDYGVVDRQQIAQANENPKLDCFGAVPFNNGSLIIPGLKAPESFLSANISAVGMSRNHLAYEQTDGSTDAKDVYMLILHLRMQSPELAKILFPEGQGHKTSIVSKKDLQKKQITAKLEAAIR